MGVVAKHSLENKDKPLVYLLHSFKQKPAHIDVVAQAKCGLTTTVIRALRRGRSYWDWSRSFYNVINNWISIQIRSTSTREIQKLIEEVVCKHCKMLDNKSYHTKSSIYRADELPLEDERDRAVHASIIEKCFDLKLPMRPAKNVLVSGVHMGKMAYQWSNGTMKNLLSG